MRKVLAAAALLLASCGGGGGGGGSSGPTMDEVAGQYDLAGFTVRYDNGTVVTQNDVSTYSGVFDLFHDGSATQQVELNGTVSPIHTGLWSVSGHTMTFNDLTAGVIVYATFTFDGTTLTTVSDHQNGNTYTETDQWVYVLPAPHVVLPTALGERSADRSVAGGLAGGD